MLRKLVAGIAGSLLLAAGLVAVPVSSAQAAGYVYCPFGNWNGSTWKLATAAKKPVVTHLSTLSAGPKYERTVTKSVSHVTTLSASVRLTSEVSASLGNKIISKGEAKLGLELAGSGAHTSSSTETVTEKVRNPTNHNVTMVFFRGNTKGYGTWKKSYCAQVTGSIGQVKWQTGKWNSYSAYGDGYVICGQGTKNLNSLAKAAYAKGCA